MSENNYTEDNIRSLSWREHIRSRPGMYIGKLGNGKSPDDGIYILLKEILDNSIDEFVMGSGRTIDISIHQGRVTVRDYGRGIPLGKVIDCVSKINTGGKYDSRAFKKSVGLNGVGTKAVNALSSYFKVQSIRDGETKTAEFERGMIQEDHEITETTQRKGTKIVFIPDEEIFEQYLYVADYVEGLLWNYAYLNRGLTLIFNGEKFVSENGLKDLLTNKLNIDNTLYPIIHLEGEDIELAITHINNQYSEHYHTFVNGQHTTQGGTHQLAIRESLVRVLRDFYNKQYDASDIRQSLVCALAIKVIEPVFESQTKTKLGSQKMGPDLVTIRTFINDFVRTKLDNYLHKHPETAEALQKQILRAERERKELEGVKKLSRQRAKKASLHNKKLRDCRKHFHNQKGKELIDTFLFITEGDSASGSITKSRDVNTQAVFSLKGKPLNCFGLSKKVVYENEEFSLLQAALNIEDGLDGLRYNKIVIATDADVDGMHIRLLLMTFFLQFFPELIEKGYLYILETPLFRVRNKQETRYCYDENEKQTAISELKGKAEITRFKGLGEISPSEFKHFIGKNMRLDPVLLRKDTTVEELLEFYMGKNTPKRREFIVNNLRIENETIL